MRHRLHPHPRHATVMLAAAAVLALAACSPQDERSAGQKLDAAVAKTAQTATAAQAELTQEARDAKASVKTEAAQAASDISAAAARARVAAADATARTSAALEGGAERLGDKAQDAGITAMVNAELAKDSTLSLLRINVDTVGGQVSLRGSAPSALARDRATTLARAVKGVVSVDNQLEVRG